jgi:hypothetical protein
MDENKVFAQVLESVDNQDLKSCGASRVGSSPTLGTHMKRVNQMARFIFKKEISMIGFKYND